MKMKLKSLYICLCIMSQFLHIEHLPFIWPYNHINIFRMVSITNILKCHAMYIFTMYIPTLPIPAKKTLGHLDSIWKEFYFNMWSSSESSFYSTAAAERSTLSSLELRVVYFLTPTLWNRVDNNLSQWYNLFLVQNLDERITF